MSRKRIFILGAGLSGLSVAWHLQKRGIDCQIFEKESEIGGLCRSKKINGFTFDFDGHLLHFKHSYTFNLIKSLLKHNLFEHQRNAWIYSYGRYTHYPFQANLYGLSPLIVKECLLGFIDTLKDGKPKKKNPNFLDWINHAFGKGIARHFMIPYNTKFWTVPPQKLTCEWLDGFIPVPSLDQLLEGTMQASQRQFGYNKRFWYPEKGGTGRVPLALASQVRNIHADCQVVKINLEEKEIMTASGDKEKFDYLISTIPLPEVPRLIAGIPQEVISSFKKLKWNSIFNLNLGIDKKDDSGRHWIYFPHQETCFFRVGFPHNFSSYVTPLNKNSMYVEVAYSKDKPIDKNKIVLQIEEDLRKVGLLSESDKICARDINDIEYGYPIYDVNYNRVRTKILKYLDSRNVISCGRYGSWRYFSMEDSILEGKRIAEVLSKNV